MILQRCELLLLTAVVSCVCFAEPGAFSKENKTALDVNDRPSERSLPILKTPSKEREFLTRLKETPNNSSLQYDFGKYLADDEGKTKQGLKHLKLAVKYDPSKQTYKLAVLDILLRLKYYKEALAYAKQCDLPERPMIGDFAPRFNLRHNYDFPSP